MVFGHSLHDWWSFNTDTAAHRTLRTDLAAVAVSGASLHEVGFEVIHTSR
jgi:hypothetical protein